METVKKPVQNERHEATAKYIARSDDVSVLGLTTRSANCLHRAGIHTVGSLINFPAEKLISINNIGVKSLEEIETVLQRIKSDDNGYLVLTESADSIVNNSRCTLPSNQLLKDAAQQLAAFFGEGDDVWFRELSYIINVASDLSMAIVTDRIYSSECFRAKIKQMVLEHIDLNNNQSCLSVLQNTLPQCLSNMELFHELLQEMESEELIAFDNEFVCRKYPGLLECINQIENEADRNLLIARLNGKTLDEIGREVGLSQQRIRMKVKSLLHKIPRVEEEKYRYIIKNYNISLEDFQLAFDEPKLIYYFLLETHLPESTEQNINDNGRKDIRDILDDENIPYKLRKQAEKITLKNFVFVNGEFIKKRKNFLIKYFIKTFCSEETTLDNFVRLYHDWLAELGVFGDDKLSLDHHGVKNFLFKSEFVLCSLGNTFRYYDIAAYDFSELLEVLNLNSYVNLEISTLKLFRDYKELMIRFDIRNEYELHNLLKKIMPQDNGSIKFGRTPNIEIGTVDRKKQLCDFLLAHSPITVEDAAHKYEEDFGVKGATLIADYLPHVGEYLHNGVYHLFSDALSDEEISVMKRCLPGDFYAIYYVRHMYHRKFPRADTERINPHTIKSLGFTATSNCALRNKYASATDYFNELLTDEDIFDVRDISNNERSHPTYAKCLRELKSKREIVEFEPRRYIHIRRLNKMGVTREMLADYCDKAKYAIKEGTYFTVRSLRNGAFNHPLHDLKFDDWFYTSILAEDKEQFRCARICNTRLFRRGNQQASLSDLLIGLLRIYGNLDLYDIPSFLHDTYGLYIEEPTLLKFIHAAGLYVDEKSGVVYSSEADWLFSKTQSVAP